MRRVILLTATTGVVTATAAVPEVRAFVTQAWGGFLQQDVFAQFGILAGLIGALGFPGILLALPVLGNVSSLRAERDRLNLQKLEQRRRISEVKDEIGVFAARSPASVLAGGAPLDAAQVALVRAGNLDALLSAAEGLVRLCLNRGAAAAELKAARAAISLCAACGWKPETLPGLDRSLHAAEHAAGLRKDAPIGGAGRTSDAEKRVHGLCNESFKAVAEGKHELGLSLAEQALGIVSANGLELSVAGFRASLEWTRAIFYGGDFKRGLDELEALLPVHTDILGPKHDLIIAARVDRVHAMIELGRAQQALNELSTLIPLATEQSGETDPRIFIMRGEKIRALERLHRNEEALEELEALLPLRTRLQGARFPGVMLMRLARGRILRALNRGEEALGELDRLLPLQLEVLGDRHPHVLVTRSDRVHALDTLGRHDEALAEIDDLLVLQREVLGPSHPDTLAMRHARGQILASLGRLPEALEEARGVLGIRQRTLPPGHDFLAGTGRLVEKIEQSLALSAGDDGKAPEAPGADAGHSSDGGSGD